jgi:hypothetical protein
MNIASFSGGRTSAYMCYLLKKMNIPDLEFIFMDTGAEHPKTYEFIKKCDNYFDLNLKVLRPVINQEMGVGVNYKVLTTNDMGWDISIMKELTKKYGTFNYLTPLCTSMLKTTVAQKYIKQFDNVTQWIGIRIDERRRLKDKKGFKYLAEVSSMSKRDILGWWNEQPFDLEIPEHLGNCVFCVKKNANYIALAQRDEPDLYRDWADMITQARQRGDVPKEVMYRGEQSIDGIVKFYSAYEYEEIKQTIRMYKNKNTVCSDSCEAFQMEMF